MNRFLLDTHTLIWLLAYPSKLSKSVIQKIKDPNNSIIVSNITFWEISIKYRLGKLEINNLVPSDIPKHCQEIGLDIHELTSEDASTFFRLKSDFHKDPFDRILIWQAIQNDFIIISNDSDIHQYKTEGLRVFW